MFTSLISHDTNGLFIGETSGKKKTCLAGTACGGSLLAVTSGGAKDVPYAKGAKGYFLYGTGQFDGQGSGHDFMGTVFLPPTGWINNCDGGRSHTYCGYRQQ